MRHQNAEIPERQRSAGRPDSWATPSSVSTPGDSPKIILLRFESLLMQRKY